MDEGADRAALPALLSTGSAAGRGRAARVLALALLVLSLGLAGCTARSQPGETADATPVAVTPSALPAPSSTEEALQLLLSARSPSSPTVGEEEIEPLRRFYAARDYQPIWVDAAGLQPASSMLLTRLAQIGKAGGPAVPDRLSAESLPAQQRAVGDWAELELQLSAAFLRAAVDPQDSASQTVAPTALTQAATASDKRSFFGHWLPIDPAFWRLRAAARAYQDIQAGGGWPSVPAGPKLVRGDEGPRVEALNRRLLVTGDLTEASGHTDGFDATLEEAVKRFQRRHGLLADGVVGAVTLDALNQPIARRLDSMAINLARLQQEERDWGLRYVAVNTAAATYRLVDGGRQVFERVAIVGRRDWPTPQLDSVIDRLEFNPYWVVPPRIARLELLPKIERPPDYMRRHDMHWVGGQIRQDPGPQNPLGVVKFLFPNPYDVYLHDTNSPKLFERQDRFLSHGCMRISDALALAAYLLKDDPQWSPDRIEAVVKAGRNLQVRLVDPIPVHVVYDTAWVDESGTVQFRDDVYGRDRQVTASLPTPGGDGSSSSCKG